MQLFELTILDFIQKMHHPVLDTFFIFITKLGDKGRIFVYIAIGMLLFKSTYKKIGILVLASLAFQGAVVNGFIKPLVARIRPYEVNNTITLLTSAPGGYAFPSGHTAAAFTFATVLYRINKRWGTISFIFAFLMGFSRMYLYVHYPTDVLIGAIIGVGIGVLATYFAVTLKIWSSLC